MARFGGAASAVAILVALSTSAEGLAQSTGYAYDVHGRLVSVTRPNATTTYTYDKAQNRTRVVIAGSNSAPVANNDSASVSAGMAVSFNPLSNDSDADSDAFFLTSVSGWNTSKGSVSFTANCARTAATCVTYTANSGASGTDSFTYAISDGKGGTANGSVNVTINAAVAVPTVAAATTTITANTSNNVLTTSITGSATSVAVTSSPANGSTSISGTTIRYTPNTNWSGVNTLSYTASNASGTSSPAQLTVQVKPTVNPVSDVAVTYNTAKSISLSPITNYSALSVAGNPSKGSVTISGATATYTPNNGQTGSDSFSYRATTGGVAGDPQTVSLTISSPPAGPVASNDSITVPYGSGITFQPKNNDSGTGLTITAATQPPVGRTAFDADNIWVGDMGEGGFNTSFQYTITDNLGRTATATVNVTAAPNPNPPPVAQNDYITIPYGGSLTFQPMNNDTGTAIQIVSVTAPSVGNFAHDAGNIWYGTVGTWSGTTSMQYTIRDSSNRTATATAYVTVQPNPSNTAPVANNDTLGGLTVGDDYEALVLANDTDANGDALTITGISTTNGSKAYYTNNGSSIEVTPKAKGSETITYTISDGRGGTATGSLTIVVTSF